MPIKILNPTVKIFTPNDVIINYIDDVSSDFVTYTSTFTKILKCPCIFRVYIINKTESSKYLSDLEQRKKSIMTYIVDTIILSSEFIRHESI